MNSGMLAQFLDYPENLLSDLGLAAPTEDMHILAE